MLDFACQAEPIDTYHHYTISSNGNEYLMYSSQSDQYFDITCSMSGYLDLHWAGNLESNEWDCVLLGTEQQSGINTYRVHMSTNSPLTQVMMDSASGFFKGGGGTLSVSAPDMSGFVFNALPITEMMPSPNGTLPPYIVQSDGMTPPSGGGPCVQRTVETLAIPDLDGDHEVHVFDYFAQSITIDDVYDHAGYFAFDVPSWDRWYWVGVYDVGAGQYVQCVWICHFTVN
jgi:hypothetical protein